MKNYYNILGVSRNALPEEIRKAYRNLAKKYHPDSNPNNLKVEEKFKEVNEAYETLNNIEKKAQYDKTLKEKQYSQQTNFDFNKKQKNETSIFENDRLEYIKFLEENEERANRCGRTLKPLIKEAYIIPGLVIYETKARLKNELEVLERNCKAYDEFIEFLDKNEEKANLCSKSLIEIKKSLSGKRGTISEKEIFKRMPNLYSQLMSFEKERKNNLETLEIRLNEKSLTLETYLAERNLTENTISSNGILKAIKAIDLIDKIEAELLPLGISINELLKANGKNLIEMRYNELVRIEEVLRGVIPENKTLEDILTILFYEEIETKKRA